MLQQRQASIKENVIARTQQQASLLYKNENTRYSTSKNHFSEGTMFCFCLVFSMFFIKLYYVHVKGKGSMYVVRAEE